MRIGVWGAGRIGTALVRRLATTVFASEIVWTNRTIEKMEPVAIDVEQSLALSPTCHRVVTCAEAHAAEVLNTCHAVVLTQGEGVPRGGARADSYDANANILRAHAIPTLREYPGVVIVVTNPVDSISRLFQKESKIPCERVLGLGTVVETARLRTALSGYLMPIIPGRDLWCFVVGTHDENFVEIIPAPVCAGAGIGEDVLSILRPALREEVRLAAERIKAKGGRDELREALARIKRSVEADAPKEHTLKEIRLVELALGSTADVPGTCQPIVEGVVQVLEAIASDRRATLTVSTLDPDEDEYYSVPCTVGRDGVLTRHTELLRHPEVRERLRRCVAALRIVRGANGPQGTA